MVGGELRQILVNVEDNRDRYNENDGIDIGSDKLLDDISVYA